MGKDVLTDGRAVYISGSIDPEMHDERREIRELALIDKTEPISLVINSGGGAVLGALALLDEMDAIRGAQGSTVTFHGWVEGFAASAALTILQACDRRIAGSYSVLMAHGTTYGMRGDLIDRRAEERFIQIVHERMARLYAGRSRMHIGDWMRLFEDATPQYYTPGEALSLGLIDEIAGA